MNESEEIYETLGNHQGAIHSLRKQLEMLIEQSENATELFKTIKARITKLETSIVQLCNEEEPDVDWAEIAQQRIDNEEGWRDR